MSSTYLSKCISSYIQYFIKSILRSSLMIHTNMVSNVTTENYNQKIFFSLTERNIFKSLVIATHTIHIIYNSSTWHTSLSYWWPYLHILCWLYCLFFLKLAGVSRITGIQGIRPKWRRLRQSWCISAILINKKWRYIMESWGRQV